MAYSPLAAGILTGKYLDDALPEDPRHDQQGPRRPPRPAFAAGGDGIRGARPRAWAGPGPDGAGLLRRAALHGLGHPQRHQPRAVAHRSRRGGGFPDGGDPCKHRRDTPTPSDADLNRLTEQAYRFIRKPVGDERRRVDGFKILVALSSASAGSRSQTWFDFASSAPCSNSRNLPLKSQSDNLVATATATIATTEAFRRIAFAGSGTCAVRLKPKGPKCALAFQSRLAECGRPGLAAILSAPGTGGRDARRTSPAKGRKTVAGIGYSRHSLLKARGRR